MRELMRHSAAFVLLVVLCACSSTANIDVDVNEPVQRLRVDSYSVRLEGMPGFLEPFFRDELVAALAARGATQAPANGDAEFVLRYEQTPLGPERPNAAIGDRNDALGDRNERQEPARFVARVDLSLRLRGDPNTTHLGSLSRVHTVTTGEYMHQRARLQIRQGFERLLRGVTAASR